MANSLLDFVMSVVRDPEAAARFAANPDQAILDANLTNVTSADVNALIPVVSESLSTAPTTGLDGGIGEAAGNVWTSGAATAAFDAFGDHVPAEALDGIHSTATDLIDDPDAGVHAGLDALSDVGIPDVAGADDASLQFDGPVIDDAPADDLPAIDDWSQSVGGDQQLDTDSSTGFDLFD